MSQYYLEKCIYYSHLESQARNDFAKMTFGTTADYWWRLYREC